MTKEEFTEKIKIHIRNVRAEKSVKPAKEEFVLLEKFPSLREIIVDLLTDQFTLFIEDIQYVAPRPTTFRVILKNGYDFYLIYAERSWIAEVEGKSYYLLNLGEEEGAAEAIARLLRYSKDQGKESFEGGGEEEFEETEIETETEEDTGFEEEI